MKVNESILKVLLYFDIFRYPLTVEEINSFLELPVGKPELEKCLDELLLSRRVYRLDEFYSLQNDPSLVERRRRGNAYADVLLKKAEKIGKLLYAFPYIRGIGLSGSVSKNFADENADIDYFIITKANRLWIARTLLILFRRTRPPKNRKKYYCINYFIDEADLIIKEQNIYTATDLYTLVPLAGNGSLQNFFDTNTWSHHYFPNRSLPIVRKEFNFADTWWKNLGEFLLNNKLGDLLDNYLLKLTRNRWRKKEEKGCFNSKGERMGLEIDKHYAKPKLIYFHNSFLKDYSRRISEINLGLKLTKTFPASFSKK